jgi:hypothetical protein
MKASNWVRQLVEICRAMQQQHVDIFVDQAVGNVSIFRILPLIASNLSWFSLLTGTPEEGQLPQAPILVRVQLDDWQHMAFLNELAARDGAMQDMLVLVTPVPFDWLCEVSRGWLHIEKGGRSGMLRFYDPRVFPTLMNDLLDPAQQQRFLELALCWNWLDRDRQVAWQPGTYLPNDCIRAPATPIVLSDDQFDGLGCIGDAHVLLSTVEDLFPQENRQAHFARSYQLARQARSENYFGDMSTYVRLQLKGSQND